MRTAAAIAHNCVLGMALLASSQRVFAQQASGIAFKAPSDASLPGPGQWLGAILACGALLAVLLWALKRSGGHWSMRRARAREIRVIERTPLTANVALVTVEYQGRKLLLATGASHTTCLRDDPLGEEPAEANASLAGERSVP